MFEPGHIEKFGRYFGRNGVLFEPQFWGLKYLQLSQLNFQLTFGNCLFFYQFCADQSPLQKLFPGPSSDGNHDLVSCDDRLWKPLRVIECKAWTCSINEDVDIDEVE